MNPTRRSTSRARVCAALVLVFACASSAAADEIEAYLPEETFLYVGAPRPLRLLETLAGWQTAIAPAAAPLLEQAVAQIWREVLVRKDAPPATLAELAAGLGIDPERPAGFALVGSPAATAAAPVFLLILPLKDRARAEAALFAGPAERMRHAAAAICRATTDALTRCARTWRLDHPGDAKVTLEMLIERESDGATLACPCGGKYSLSDDGQTVTCSLHGRGDLAFKMPLNKEALSHRDIADVTVRGVGAGAGRATRRRAPAPAQQRRSPHPQCRLPPQRGRRLNE